MCLHNDNIPINIPGHPYVLMNQSILCNCDIKAENNFLLVSLGACEGSETKTDLEMHFTLNVAFVNYFDDMMEELGIPVSQNWTTQEQILPLSLETFEINPNLFNAPKMLEDLAIQYQNKRNTSKQERTRIRQSRGKFQIQIIPKQFSSRHTYIHSHTYNSDHNTGYNICYVWMV